MKRSCIIPTKAAPGVPPKGKYGYLRQGHPGGPGITPGDRYVKLVKYPFSGEHPSVRLKRPHERYPTCEFD